VDASEGDLSGGTIGKSGKQAGESGGGMGELGIEDHLLAAAELRDLWMNDIGEEAEDLTTGDVDVVLDGAEKLVNAFRKEDKGRVDIQSLDLRKRSAVEQGFAKYSALGQVCWVSYSALGQVPPSRPLLGLCQCCRSPLQKQKYDAGT
jgi:hypothetical protein